MRRMQWHLAEKSAPMAIFLGKNYLGQSDTAQEEKNNTADYWIECVVGADRDD